MSGAWRAFSLALGEVGERAFHIVNIACCYSLFTTHCAELTVCLGPSMLPTLNASGDIVLMEHLSPWLGGLKEGDVVVAKSPTNPRMTICKRILGMPGDTLFMSPLNPLDLPKPVTVPQGHVWLQGDNLVNSTDSRNYGPVPAALVKGKVVYRVWPPRAWGPIGR